MPAIISSYAYLQICVPLMCRKKRRTGFHGQSAALSTCLFLICCLPVFQGSRGWCRGQQGWCAAVAGQHREFCGTAGSRVVGFCLQLPFFFGEKSKEGKKEPVRLRKVPTL